MSDINLSIEKTLLHEGGYVDNKNDSGGKTKFGITEHDLPGVDIEHLTQDQAIEYYKAHYVKEGYAQIQDQAKLDKIFDLGVLFGVGTAIKLLQRVLNLQEDGVFGPGTLAATNATDLLQAYKTAFVERIGQIVQAHPQDKVFYTGWLNRINS